MLFAAELMICWNASSPFFGSPEAMSLPISVSAERIILLQQQRHDAHVLGMVGDRAPVVGRLFLDHFAGGRLLDRLALAEPVGVVRPVARAEGEGVGRVHRMQVLLAEIDVLQRVRLARLALRLSDRVGGKGDGGHGARGHGEGANQSEKPNPRFHDCTVMRPVLVAYCQRRIRLARGKCRS